MNAEDIRKMRKTLKMTQTDLSKKLGVSLKTIQNYEAGEVIPDSKKELLRMVLSGNTDKDEAIIIDNGNVMMIPLVSQYAYAGYLCGYSDPEYMESLPKVPVVIEKEGKGNYMMFEVRGDSMEENSRDGIYEGDKLYCREIKKDLWQYKLHLNQWDFVIVHKTDGILVKRIIDHNTNTGDITIHSLNPFYENRVLNLNDVGQLFNVVEVIRGRRR
ncbi:MAG: helix-turn-helix domain-containing protein [Dysgonomonas sp.]|uniref:helix-turn-helix domain-containing protein n=1 Tax=Dysgonomonas sp. TaxID=1891233 RepID=UPI0039E64629